MHLLGVEHITIMVNPDPNMGAISNLLPSTMVTQFTIMVVLRPYEDLLEVKPINLAAITTIPNPNNNTVQQQRELFLVIYKHWLIP